MPRKIDLHQVAKTADAAAFRAAVAGRDAGRIGADRFTASGSDKQTDAAVRPDLSGADFTASGIGKPKD